jgi:catechol 2,3-dioxygenase-like lactoylglutathione lyase family enzyme
MLSGLRFGLVVEYVQDIAVARRFYTEILGVAVERENPTFVQFDRFAIASDAPMDDSGEAELYWFVDDADSAFRSLPPRTDVSLPLTQRPFGRVFGIRDLDGHVRYVLELAANRPSRPA